MVKTQLQRLRSGFGHLFFLCKIYEVKGTAEYSRRQAELLDAFWANCCAVLPWADKPHGTTWPRLITPHHARWPLSAISRPTGRGRRKFYLPSTREEHFTCVQANASEVPPFSLSLFSIKFRSIHRGSLTQRTARFWVCRLGWTEVVMCSSFFSLNVMLLYIIIFAPQEKSAAALLACQNLSRNVYLK